MSLKNLGFFGQKTTGLETLLEDNLGPILRKPIKQHIFGGSPSLRISRLKNTYISQIFA